jgi:DNA invertase Pin-like site-specific DNA recombinase
MDDTTKTDDQERICRELAARLGWDVAQVYTDHSRSAWARNRKRPGWDAMLAAVESGAITAIIVYHGDRLIRQPDDLGALLKLADGKGVLLASPSGTRDLANYDDRFVLYIEAAMAMRESDNTSRRRKMQYARMRRSGLVRAGGRGGRAFGFETDGVTHIPAECELIREAARRILAGEGTKVIAADWRQRGIASVTGVTVEHSTIRKVLTRPRVAGLMPDGIARAAWEPVLDPGDWQMTCAVLAARAAGFGYATNARKYLLSGIAVCGVCGTPLQVNPSKGRSGTYVVGYACRAAGCKKVYRSQPLLDAFVSAAVVRRLNHPASPQPQRPALPGVAAELAALTERRAEAEAVIASLAEHPGQRIDVLARALASFDGKITALAEQLAARNGAALIAMHAGISREEFAALPLATRRELVRGTWHVTVLPASRRGPGFEPRDVILAPADPGL